MLEQRSNLLTATLLVLIFTPQLGWAQTVDSRVFTAGKTPWGHPDIQGVWDRRTITPLERPERFADKAFLTAEEIIAYEKASAAREDGKPLDARRTGITVHDPQDLDYGSSVLATGQTSLVVDPSNGRIPAYTQAAVERAAAEQKLRGSRGSADSWTDRSLIERCLTWGMPQGMLPQPYNNNIQIVQTANEVMILTEMVHDVRIIPLDGRPHIPDNITQWHGDARGHWIGETLVIETTNFSAKSSFRRSGSNLHLEERYTRIADDRLQYEFTVTDDTTWEQPWTVSFPMVKGGEPLYEFACHEGNYGLENILRAARHLEKQQQ